MKLLRCLPDMLPNLQRIYLEINSNTPGTLDELDHAEEQLHRIKNDLRNIQFVYTFDDEVINRILTFEAKDAEGVTTAHGELFQVFVIPEGQTNSLEVASFENAEVIDITSTTSTSNPGKPADVVCENTQSFEMNNLNGILLDMFSIPFERSTENMRFGTSGSMKKISGNMAQVGSAH